MTVSALKPRDAKRGASSPRTLLTSPRARVALVLLVVMGVVALVVAHYVTRVTEWRVMRDELLYLDISRGIADNLIPLPVVRGDHVQVYSILYPLIIAPFVGFLDAPAAFQVIRIVNVVVMVSTAIPTYLLAREGSTSRTAGLIAATLSVLVPWMAQSTSLMTEVAGYPAFAWAVYAMTRAIAVPGPRRDFVALGAIGIACLARTQFLVLLVAFPVAALVHEIGRRLARDRVRNIRSILVRGTYEGLRAHVVITAVVGVGGLLLAVASPLLLGSYAETTYGNVLPAGLAGSAVEHLAYIAVGMGALPVVFGMAFALETFGRAVDARPHALASVLLVVVVAMTLAVASFDLRFVLQGRTVQERYLFYICPLLFAGAVAWFAHRRGSPIPTAIAALGTAGVILSRTYEPQPDVPIEGFASPNRYSFAVLEGRLREAESHLGLHSVGPAFVIAGACVLLAALAVALLRGGRARLALAAFGISVGAFLAAQLVYVLPRVVNDHNSYARSVRGMRPLASRDWVEKHVSGSTGVVEVGPVFNSIASWDLEFWNPSVDRVYRLDRVGDNLTPIRLLSLNFNSGALDASGGRPPSQLVVSAREVRFAPEYRGSPVSRDGFTLYRTPVPYRAGWATRGIDEDGWTVAGQRVVLRVYARRGTGPELRRVRILLGGGEDIKKPRRYTLTGNGLRTDRVLRTNVDEQFDVCPPAGGHADVTLHVHGRTRLGARNVGLRVLLIQARSTGRSCRPT
jgi:dolichyl-phosphate-mannose-protein mannosyltransferase